MTNFQSRSRWGSWKDHDLSSVCTDRVDSKEENILEPSRIRRVQIYLRSSAPVRPIVLNIRYLIYKQWHNYDPNPINIFIIFLEKLGKFAGNTKLRGVCQREGMPSWRIFTGFRGGHLRTSWSSIRPSTMSCTQVRAIPSTNTFSLSRQWIESSLQ